MRCGGCGHDNRTGRRFCAGCGAALAAACARCGFANLPDERFCGGCGAALAGPAPQGERRQVAILFADLAGYTRLSTTLDPEEVHRLLTGFFEVVDGCCTRFGGTIDKHIGDNVMAIFGAPVAHGDDPERAVRAAVEIHAAVAAYSRRVGRELAVHVGIGYGEVMASGLGSSHHTEYTVTGDAVNLAARLQDRAVGGETLVSDAVYRAAARIAVAEPVGDVTVKGLAAPVPVWKITAIRAAAATTQVIGRADELAAIAARVAAGGAVVLRGDPGIGKSALAGEAARRAAEAGLAVHAGQVLDFGAGRGAGAIATLVASLLGAGEDDDERRAALDAAVDAGRVDAGDAPHLASLLELDAEDHGDLDDRERRDRQHAALAALIAGAAPRPLLVIEDVHWADAATQARLRHALAAVRARGAAALITTRVDGDPIDEEWRAAAGELLELDLEPLPAADAARLAAAHLADDELVARCVERAGGNPLFLEQLVHAATRDASLPGTLQGVVLARVDRLGAADKAALQAASVAGQRVSLALIRHLTGDPGWTPDEVIARRLLRPAGDDDLVFHHALIVDGIYASLTHARRRDLHRAAAAFHAGDDLGLRAEHLERAGDPGASAAWLAAARDHAAMHDLDRALEQIARGLACAKERGDRHDLHAFAGQLHLDLGEGTAARDAWADALADAPDELARCRALIGLAGAGRLAADHAAASRALDEAEPIARALGLEVEQATLAYYRGSVAFSTGRAAEVVEHHERALAHARRAGSIEWEVRALSGRADGLYAQGRLAEAEETFGACVALCEQHGMARFALVNRAMVADSSMYLCRFREAEAILRAVVDESVALRDRRAEALARESLILCLSMSWQGEAIAEHLAPALEACRGNAFFEAQIHDSLAEWLAQQGRREEAQRAAELAMRSARTIPGSFIGTLVRAGELLFARTRDERRALLERVDAEIAAAPVLGAIRFHSSAIEACLADEDWPCAAEQATRLRGRCQDLPYGVFLAERGLALARWGAGERGDDVRAELARLRATARASGIRAPFPA